MPHRAQRVSVSLEGRLQVSQIKYFLALCDNRSFSRAAKACGVSQPSLSNAIKRLENTLGVYSLNAAHSLSRPLDDQ
jgi:DNA-binding MarR family transcriptional regulator